MTTANQTSASGASTQDPAELDGDNDGDSTEQKQLSQEKHRKLLAEKKAVVAALKEANDKLAAIEAEKKRIELKKLEEKGEYQKAIELRDKELAEAKAKLEQRDLEDLNRRKLAAVLSAAGGKIEAKFHGLIDYEDVVIVDGQVDEMSVKKVVEKVKTNFPEILKDGKHVKTDNSAPHNQTGGRIKRSDWMKLDAKEMKKYRPDQIDDTL